MPFQKGHKLGVGRVYSEESKLKMSLAHKGKKLSEEQKKKIGEALKGHKVSEKTLQALRTPKIFTEEYRLKLSIAAKKRSESPEARKKLGEPNIGNKYNLDRHPSEEVRLKISNTLKGRYVGDKNPSWKGGIITGSYGYIMIRKPEHPSSDKRGYVLLSHLVMEESLGRQILPTEVVHHINEDRTDNRLENLMVLSRDEHPSYHRKQKNLL